MPYGLRSKNHTVECCGLKVHTSADDNHSVYICSVSGIAAEDCKIMQEQMRREEEAAKEGKEEESQDSLSRDGNETDGSYSPSHSGNDTVHSVHSSPSIAGNNTGASDNGNITEDRPPEDGTPADLGFQTQPQHPVTPGPFPDIAHDTSTVGTFAHTPIRDEPEHGPEFPATDPSHFPAEDDGGLTPAIRRLNFGSPSIEERLLGITRRLATLEAENLSLKRKIRRLEGPEFTGLGTIDDPIVLYE